MHTIGLLVALSAAAGGAAVVALGLTQARRPVTDVGEYLGALDEENPNTNEFQQRLDEPFLIRVVRPLGAGVLNRIARLTPQGYVENIHHKLLLAGLTPTMRAEELVTIQAVITALAMVVALAYVVLASPGTGLGIAVLVMMPLLAVLSVSSWLTRKVTERKQAVLKDLPDTLDLLAISVEAGLGFEGAIEVVCQHFQSPLAEEFARTLREMELGLPRREAFHNLKRRTEVPELSNFVLAIMQADSLGIPIGRVLRTQATEMRSKRRQWAREKAGKLPVKILFPLMPIFFSILVVILAPAGAGILKALS